MNVFVHGKVINKPHKYLSWIERNPNGISNTGTNTGRNQDDIRIVDVD
jgi:hypothetical protein